MLDVRVTPVFHGRNGPVRRSGNENPRTDAVALEMLEASQQQRWQRHKMAAVGRLSDGTAHEFNNLMQGVVAFLELARKLMSRGRVSQAEPLILKAIASAQNASLVNQRVARFARRRPVVPQLLSMNAVVADLEDMLRDSLSGAFDLQIDLAANPDRVYCDAGQAEIAIVDMVLDARDSMPNGGAITIATRNAGEDDDRTVPRADDASRRSICVEVTATSAPDRTADDRRLTSPSPAEAADRSSALPMVEEFARIYGGQMRLRDDALHSTVVELLLPCNGSSDGLVVN
jgi:signal transduction histidine kinase